MERALLAAALAVHGDGIQPLLPQAVQHPVLSGFVERAGGVDLLLLEGRLDHPESAEAGAVLGLHGGDHFFLNLVE